MFNGHTVAVVIPAYNEQGTIFDVVSDFKSSEFTDQVIVVDNNCSDETAERARDAGALVIEESDAGYGCALRAGMNTASEDIIVLTEADGSFKAKDLIKLLVYLDTAGMVLGTRTTRQMVQQGANMDFILRWGNVMAAKILQLLWYIPHEPRLTDVGCTYRVLWREKYDVLRDGLTDAGPGFSPEMICEAFRHGVRVIEVPVSYHARVAGESSHSGGFLQVVRTAGKMFRRIFAKRLQKRPSRRIE